MLLKAELLEFEIRDLETNNQTSFLGEVNAWNYSMDPHSSFFPIYDCAGTFYLGGFNFSPSQILMNKFFERTYLNLPPHSTIIYSFNVFLFDSWSYSLNPHDTFQILFDTLSPINYGPFDGDVIHLTHLCGNPNFGDTELKMTGWISHSSLSLTLRFNLKLDQTSDDESFGIRDIQLTFTNKTFASNYNCAFYYYPDFFQTRCVCPQNQFNFQTINCNTCHSPNCTSCIDSGVNRCYECSKGNYLTSAAPGTCNNCHPICTSCFGPGTTNCLNCTDGFYLSGTTCHNCDPACPTCFGAGTTNCYTCSQQYYLNGTTCHHCHSSCLNCTSLQYNQCIACFPGFILFRGVCIESNRCLSLPFTINITNNECHSPCLNQNFSSWNLSCFPACLTSAIPETDAICKGKLY